MLHVIARKHFSRAAKACEYFVGNTQHILFFRVSEHPVEHVGAIHPHPARGLYERLVNETRDIVILHDCPELPYYIFRGIRRREVNKSYVEQQRVEGTCEESAFADSHGSERVSMISTFQRDDLSLFNSQDVPVLQCHL